MKRTIFIICHDLHTKHSGQNYAKKILQCVQNAADSELFMLIKTGSDFDKPVCMFNAKEWINPQELHSLLTSSFEECHLTTDKPRDGDQDLSSVLHKAADSLPYLGTLLSVIFFFGSCEEEDDSKCKSFLSVAGAMKRLAEWHNADAMVTSVASPLPSIGQKLVDYGIFRVVSGSNFPRRPLMGWTGNVVLMDKCESKGFVLPGYQLECADWSSFLQKKLSPLTCLPKKPRFKTRKSTSQQSADVKQHVLGRCIEILHEIDLRTLPLFLLDNWTLLLSVKEGVSSSVFNYIQGLQQTGLLGRLRIYNEVGEIPLCGQLRNLRTEAWKERITSNYCNLSEPEEMNIAHEYKYLYFVLLPLDPSKSGIHLSVKAQVLLSPYEINESIFQVFEGTRVGNTTSISSHSSFDNKDELFIQPDKFLTLLNIFSESPNFLQQTKKDFVGIQEALAQKGFPKEYQAGNSIDIFDQVMMMPESSLSLEKRILEAKVSARTTCQSSPYLDSLMSSSPKTATERNIDSWDFNVGDLLQSFKQSESLIPSASSPVKVKRRGFCRFESQPDFFVSWPNSQQLMAPDIYYYRDENDMLFEQTYAKIRDKSNNFDTMTTFMSPLKKKVKSMHATASASSVNRSSTRHLKGDLQRIASLMSPSLQSGEPPSKRQSLVSRTKKTESPLKNRQLVSESSEQKQSKSLESLSSRLRRSESMTQQLRVSPRKLAKSLTKSSSTTDVQSKPRISAEKQKEVTSCDKNKSDKMKRSQRHKMKLQSIVESVLNDKGVKRGDKIFDACARNLFNVSLVLLKTFTSSRNLTEEMKNVVCGQVEQIISLEVRRSTKGR